MLCAALVIGLQCTNAQNNRERRLILNDYVSPEELISMSKTLPFDKAVSLFTDFSKKYLNKIIVDPANNKKEIGVDIENMYWLQAFETVLRANSLWYEEKEEYFQIINPQDSTKALAAGGGATGGGGFRDSSSRAMLLARDIKISTVFFSIDVTKSLNTGDKLELPEVGYNSDEYVSFWRPASNQFGESDTDNDNWYIGRYIGNQRLRPDDHVEQFYSNNNSKLEVCQPYRFCFVS